MSHPFCPDFFATQNVQMSHPFSLLKWIEKKELGREKWRQFKGIVEIVDYENHDLVKSVSDFTHSGELY